jgi:hypothetical protein
LDWIDNHLVSFELMIKNTMSFIPLLADVAWSCNGTSDTSLDLGINFDGLS